LPYRSKAARADWVRTYRARVANSESKAIVPSQPPFTRQMRCHECLKVIPSDISQLEQHLTLHKLEKNVSGIEGKITCPHCHMSMSDSQFDTHLKILERLLHIDSMLRRRKRWQDESEVREYERSERSSWSQAGQYFRWGR